MDPMQKKDKDNEQLFVAIEKSKEDLPKKWFDKGHKISINKNN